MSVEAIRALLDEGEEYPKENGTVGFGMNRDQLIALLQECTPLLSSISVIPTHLAPGFTSFKITTYVSFDREELDEAAAITGDAS